MPVDPVCGMDIEPADAAGTSAYKGETIYFCNPHCKERFDADPEPFMAHLGPTGMAATQGGSPHETAKDPICGMVVDKNRSLKTEMAGRSYYFCSEGCLRTFESPEEELKSMKREGFDSPCRCPYIGHVTRRSLPWTCGRGNCSYMGADTSASMVYLGRVALYPCYTRSIHRRMGFLQRGLQCS